MKRILAALALVVAILAIGSTAALATTGSSLGTGQITVRNVWVSETHTFTMNTTETLDVDCPSGESVLTGFGIWVTLADGAATSVSGSALDSDTWRVSFNYQGSQPLSSQLQAHATCS